VIFDEQEHLQVPFCPTGTCPIFPSPFPAEAGRIAVGSASFPVPFSFGWLYLDMKTSARPSFPLPSPTQAWLGTIHTALGTFSVGYEADPRDSGCNPQTASPFP
jgi:hypothetical protein